MNKFVKKYMVNVKKPQSNFFGRMQLRRMNNRHSMLASWGYTHMQFNNKDMILDVGCGGGKNIKNMAKFAPKAQVIGVDYSQASIKMTEKLNRHEIKKGRVRAIIGTVESIPFSSNLFDLITAFETVYFWTLPRGFQEVYRALKKGGEFMIVNESQDSNGLEEYIETIGFKVYKPEELKQELQNVGFNNINIHLHENGKWVVVTAKK